MDYFDVVKIGLIVIFVKYISEVFGKLVYIYLYCEVVVDDWLIDYELLICYEILFI